MLLLSVYRTDVAEVLSIRYVSTTKRNGDSEQKEIEQRNRHTKIDILQRNKIIRIQIALYHSIYFEGEYQVSSNSEKKAYPLKMGNLYDTNDSNMREIELTCPLFSEISDLVK